MRGPFDSLEDACGVAIDVVIDESDKERRYDRPTCTIDRSSQFRPGGRWKKAALIKVTVPALGAARIYPAAATEDTWFTSYAPLEYSPERTELHHAEKTFVAPVSVRALPGLMNSVVVIRFDFEQTLRSTYVDSGTGQKYVGPVRAESKSFACGIGLDAKPACTSLLWGESINASGPHAVPRKPRPIAIRVVDGGLDFPDAGF